MKTNRRQFVKLASGLLVPATFAGLGGILRAGTAPSLKVAGTARVGSIARPSAGGTTLNDNLIAYWKMDETNQANRVDSQGANDLVVTGGTGVTHRAGIISNGVNLPANAEHLTIADNTDLSFGDESMTLALWVLFDAIPGVFATIVSKFNTSSNEEYLLGYETASNAFEWRVSGNGTSFTTVNATTFGVPSTATWYFVACGHDAAANEIWISINNGTVDSTAHSTGIFDGNSTFRVGTDDSITYHLDGGVDEMGLWGKRLSSAELTELYNSGSGKTCCPFA